MSRRADLHTAAALDAGAPAEHKLWGGAQAFGIMAPLTAQRTAFQKDGLSHAWPVMYGKFFNVKNSSGHIFSLL